MLANARAKLEVLVKHGAEGQGNGLVQGVSRSSSFSKRSMKTYLKVDYGRGGEIIFTIRYKSMFLGISKFKTDAP